MPRIPTERRGLRKAIRESYDPLAIHNAKPRIRQMVDCYIDGTVESDEELRELDHNLLHGASWHRLDHGFLLHDFMNYQETRLAANCDYRDCAAFGKKCPMNVASAGKISSIRTFPQCADEIWHV